MQTLALSSSAALVAGHGHLTLPPSTRMGGDLKLGGSCANGACYWFSNNVEIPGPETLPAEARSVLNKGPWSTSPWRAPGSAPVYGSGCGVAGGGPRAYANGGTPPPGIAQNLDGLEMPEMAPTYWQLGTSVEVAWAIAANHGGGYSYRLCKKSEGISEECFQRTPLKFDGNTSYIIDHTGKITNTFEMTKVTEGTTPPGSEWARDPVPGCNMCDDAIAQCGEPLDPVPLNETGGGYSDPWNSQVTCYGMCCGAGSSKEHGVCPDGTEFYPAVSGHSGFGKNVPDWSIMDRVQIPSDLEEGEYFLGWRWDCEESTQVWQNCADIVLTKSAPPSTTPAPTPAPTPTPASDCKDFTPDKSTYACYYHGCKTLEDDGKNCAECCSGCHLQSSSGKGTFCMEDAFSVVV